jgi:hypothetical protein
VNKIFEGKIARAKISRGGPRDNYMGKTKEVHCKRFQEVSQLGLDRVGWRAAVNQSED